MFGRTHAGIAVEVAERDERAAGVVLGRLEPQREQNGRSPSGDDW